MWAHIGQYCTLCCSCLLLYRPNQASVKAKLVLHKLLLQQSAQQLAKQLRRQLHQHMEAAAVVLVTPAAMPVHLQAPPAPAAASDHHLQHVMFTEDQYSWKILNWQF